MKKTTRYTFFAFLWGILKKKFQGPTFTNTYGPYCMALPPPPLPPTPGVGFKVNCRTENWNIQGEKYGRQPWQSTYNVLLLFILVIFLEKKQGFRGAVLNDVVVYTQKSCEWLVSSNPRWQKKNIAAKWHLLHLCCKFFWIQYGIRQVALPREISVCGTSWPTNNHDNIACTVS